MKNDQKISGVRKIHIALMRIIMAVSVLITCALVLFIIVYVLYKGLPNITAPITFYVTELCI